MKSHETGEPHKACYLMWKQLAMRPKTCTGIDNQFFQGLQTQKKKWRDLLKRILDVILFLGQRGLALQGDSNLIGDPSNGNFLGILELLSHYDSTLKEHIEHVRKSQAQGKRLQAYYLSNDSQNEFIELCGEKVRKSVLHERDLAKYYSIMVDATPDCSCLEQETFIFRYLKRINDTYSIEERLYTFIQNNGKTGEEIANMIVNFLEKVMFH